MENFKNKKIQLLSAACLNVGSTFMGTMAGWTSAVIPKLQNLKHTPLSHTINLKQGSWIGSLFSLGFLSGPILAGNVSNRFGRKTCALLGAFIINIGCILLLLANSLAMLLIGRFICGLGTGMICVNSIIYIGELASANIRGILLTSIGVCHSFGILLINTVGLASYNFIGYTVLIISMMHFLSCFYIEESPVFYLIKGKEDKTMKTLERLGRKTEIAGITHMDEYSRFTKRQEWKWQEIFNNKCNRKSMLIGLPLIIFQLCSGALLASFFTAVLGIYFYLQHIGLRVVESLSWIPLVSLMCSFISNSIGLNVIPSAILGELFLPNVRSIGCSIVKILASLVLFITITSFGYIVEHLGTFVVFWMFAIINAVCFLFTLIVVPETKGLTLAEIQTILST